MSVSGIPSKTFNSVALEVTPSRIFNSDAVEVTPSNIFNSAALEVTATPAIERLAILAAPASLTVNWLLGPTAKSSDGSVEPMPTLPEVVPIFNPPVTLTLPAVGT